MSGHRFVVLDSWRGICAMLVAIFHFTALNHLFYTSFVRHSWIFVDFFFVLSGFVIAYAYGNKLGSGLDWLSFAIRRLGRIWPLHLFVLALYIVLECVKYAMTQGSVSADRAPFSGGTSPESFFSSALLLHATPAWPVLSPNGPSWSISAEYWSYLIFGTIMVLSTRVVGVTTARAVLLASSWLIALIVMVSGPGRLDAVDATAVARCLYGFVTGCFTYAVWRKWLSGNLVLKSGTASMIEVLAVAVSAIFVALWADQPLQFLAPAVFAAAILIFSLERGVVSRLLKIRAFVILGELSFSIYMTHGFLRELFRRTIAVIEKKTTLSLMAPIDPALMVKLGSNKLVIAGGVWGGDLLLILFLTTTVAMSALTYRLVEKPGQRLFGRIAESLTRSRKPEESRPQPATI